MGFQVFLKAALREILRKAVGTLPGARPDCWQKMSCHGLVHVAAKMECVVLLRLATGLADLEWSFFFAESFKR